MQRGPVRVTAEVQPSKASISDEPMLTLTIDAEEGVAVEKPPFGATLGGFKIRGLREPLPKINNGREVIQQIYTLEPTQTGRLRIDPISVAFTDRRRNGDGRKQTVETEPLAVEITSLLGDKPPSLGDLRPPAEPIGLPSHMPLWLGSLAAVAVAAAAGGWWLARHRRREKAADAVILSPEQLANMELDKLVASGLADRDVKQFYVELTSIVRRYIERTTGIRAPEQTTEEFLREISRAQTFGGEECSRLRDFLESADLVKFAAHRPRADDIAESIRHARLFIGANRITP
ncbi:MAG: BatD family protein [Thermoguttaceae bacterium]